MKISALFVHLYKMTYQGEQNCRVDLIISLMVNLQSASLDFHLFL